MNENRKKNWVAVYLSLLLLPQITLAQNDELPDRFAIQLGLYSVYDSVTRVFSGSKSVLGTGINFSHDLGGEESDTVPRIHGYYRFNPRHRVDFSWYNVERRGSRAISRDLQFGDITFTLGTGVNSSIETEISHLSYTWSFYHVSEVELALSLGLNMVQYTVKLEDTGGSLKENESFDAFLPVLGFRMDYTINPRWHVLTDVNTFEIRTSVEGSMTSLNLALEYRPTADVAFGGSFNRMTLYAADVDEDDFRGEVTDMQRGMQLYVKFFY